jgi:CheY-like chemotaxis protein
MFTTPAVAARNILIVDDHAIVVRALSLILADAGYQTAPFLCGQDALAYVRDHPIHAAVIDIHLPDISGLVLTQRLREQLGPDIPIIIVSGDTSMENLNSLPHVGATYFFSKPLKSKQLIEQLRELIG